MRIICSLLLICIVLPGLPGCAPAPREVSEANKSFVLTKAYADIGVNYARELAAACPPFNFANIPSPLNPHPINVAPTATFSIVQGNQGPNSGPPGKLNDKQIPADGSDNNAKSTFYFKDATGGSILIDLTSVNPNGVNIKEFDSYSWHTGKRAAQRYTLYGANAGANGKPPATTGSLTGWAMIGTPVDTRNLQPVSAAMPVKDRPLDIVLGGQYGVSFTSTTFLGTFQYLLMVVSSTDDTDTGNTYFSEVTVIEATEEFLKKIQLP